MALPALFVFDSTIRTVVIVMLVISIGYTLARKPLVSAGEWLIERAPASVVALLPDELLPTEDGRKRSG